MFHLYSAKTPCILQYLPHSSIDIPCICLTCSTHIPYIFNTYSRHIPYKSHMFHRYFIHMHPYSINIPYIFHTYPTHIPYIFLGVQSRTRSNSETQHPSFWSFRMVDLRLGPPSEKCSNKWTSSTQI